jgi:hypothetical protein
MGTRYGVLSPKIESMNMVYGNINLMMSSLLRLNPGAPHFYRRLVMLPTCFQGLTNQAASFRDDPGLISWQSRPRVTNGRCGEP